MRVETPLTYASSTTAMIACSERRRGSKNDGKYELPRAFLRDQQLDLPDPRFPPPRPIPVAMRHPRLRRDLAERSANLSLKQLALSISSRAKSVTASLTKSSKPTVHRLGDDIGNRHALTFGRRVAGGNLTPRLPQIRT